MTRKLKSETSSQKIDVSADIIFGSLTLQSDFVILDLKQLHLYNTVPADRFQHHLNSCIPAAQCQQIGFDSA